MARDGVVFNHLPQIAAALRPAVRSVIDETCMDLKTDISADMAEAKHGQVYPRPSGDHQASAPGESPAVDHGFLAEVKHEMLKDDLGLVYEDQDYAPTLEYGTERMAPRPHMAPAADRARPKFVARMMELEKLITP